MEGIWFITPLKESWGGLLSEQIQQVGLKIGIAIMGSLMLLAIFNDLSRLFG
jgi:regulator of sigma E protease